MGTEHSKLLLPCVLQAAEQALGPDFAFINDAQYWRIDNHGLRKLAKALESSVSHNDRVAQASARELVRYLCRADEIQSLEKKIRATEDKLGALDAKKARRLETQNVRARRKRQLPNQREKAATLAQASARDAITHELAAQQAALADLREARAIPLRYPLPRLLLLNAMRKAREMTYGLSPADRTVAEAALDELNAEWRALAPQGPTVN